MGLPTRDEPVGAPDIAPPSSLAAARRHDRQTTSRRQWQRALPHGDRRAAADWDAARSATKRSVSIEQLLAWAYADQRVHRYLRRPVDWFLWALDDAGLASRADDRRPVHHDAALVHEAVMHPLENCDDPDHDPRQIDQDRHGRAVCKACESIAHLVIHCAATGERPQRSAAEPRPVPIEPWGTDDDFGVHEWRDATGALRRTYYRLRTEEFVLVEEDEWRLDGRKKMKRGRPRKRSTRVAVKCAPIAWDPDPSYIAMCNQMAERRERALAAIEGRLAAAEFRSHVLVRFDGITKPAAPALG